MITDDELAEYHRHKMHKASTRSLVRGALRHCQRLGIDGFSSGAMELYRDIRLTEGAAPATVRGELNKLIPLAKYLGYQPVVRLPLSPARCPNSWSKQELKRLLHEARHTKRTIWGIPGSVYWPALLQVAIESGERIGGISGLRWSDIDGSTVQFPAEVRKGGYRDASCRLSRLCLRLLSTLRSVHADAKHVFLIGSPSTLWKAYGRLLSDAGLPCDRRSKFHRLRRTAATSAYLRGEDATALMGHSSDAVTRKSYIDWVAVRQSRRHWWQRVWG